MALDAGRPYVISTHQLSSLLRDHEPLRSRVYKISELEPRVSNFSVSARKVGHQRLLLYNGSGGYGDQIMTWPIGKILFDQGFEIYVLSDPGNMTCWSNFPWVKSTLTLPVPYDVFKMFDYHALFEVVANADEHGDQQHIVDIMLSKIGIEPLAIKPEMKVIEPIFTEGENRSTLGAFPDKQLAMFQLTAAAPIRSLTPQNTANLIGTLADTFSDWHWLALHDFLIDKEYVETVKALNRTNVQTFEHPVLRELWALSRRANVVVAPDTMMIHVAGSMGIPCVGLWGPVGPDARTRYYKNHFPIFKKEACRHAPCYCAGGQFPHYCPNRETRKECDVMIAITHKDVIDMIYKATNSPQRDPSQRNGNAAPAFWSKEGAGALDRPTEVSTS
jgi:hypothetical protein